MTPLARPGSAPPASGSGAERPVRGTGLARFGDLWLALAIIAAVDVALFHAGLYLPLLQPRSYSGRVESAARRFQQILTDAPRTRHIVLMGDSTTGSGMTERVLDEQLAAAAIPVRCVNLAEGGATPNAWLPLLGSLEIDRRTTAAVVLGVFVPGLSVGREPRPDVAIAKTRLGVGDGFRLAAAYGELELTLQVACGALFRLPWYREDVRELLRAPGARRASLAALRAREQGARRAPRPPPHERSLASVAVEPSGRVSFERAERWIREDTSLREAIRQRVAWQQAILRGATEPPRPDAGYLRSLEWLVRLLHERGVPVLWAVVPESPFPTGRRTIRSLDPLRGRLAEDGIRVPVFHDVELLALLEQPRYFCDHTHLNREGAAVYSRKLGAFLASHLGPADGAAPGAGPVATPPAPLVAGPR